MDFEKTFIDMSIKGCKDKEIAEVLDMTVSEVKRKAKAEHLIYPKGKKPEDPEAAKALKKVYVTVGDMGYKLSKVVELTGLCRQTIHAFAVRTGIFKQGRYSAKRVTAPEGFKEQYLLMREKEYSIRDMMKETGYSYEFIKYHAKKLGIYKPLTSEEIAKKKLKKIDDFEERYKKLRAQGISMYRIAEEMGHCYSVVYRRAIELGLHEKGEYGKQNRVNRTHHAKKTERKPVIEKAAPVKYPAYYTIRGKKRLIGEFKTPEQAAQAERNAMQALYPGRVS